MPQSSYNSQGIEKRFNRPTRYDYLWPLFAHLGEQPVLNSEIYAQGTEDDDGVFGYQPRYQEYRKRLNRVSGEFRSDLDYWHLSRNFSDLPLLNDVFVNSMPSNRIFADTSVGTQKLRVHLYHRMHALRHLPKFGNPGYIDH